MLNDENHERDRLLDGVVEKSSEPNRQLTNESSDLGQLIRQVDEEQVPVLIESGKHGAWLVPNRLWRLIRTFSLLVNDPEHAKSQREEFWQTLRADAERVGNDPEDRAEMKRILDELRWNARED
ncbi:hypothetical protein [Rhodococcus marinonascens]|uniref:hypothetical protein n=1 Tax=Rhodococcus marinonascens TaxID=38311 RepID=UPI0009333739|nr:hypothetical protein [Rhodococcus marinonascens]